MRFKVPQFLDIEDKIFGPFTFRQFIYLAGGAGLSFVLYKLLGFWLGAIPVIAVASASLALAFYRPNSKPFINMVEAGFSYFIQDKLYIWKKRKLAMEDSQSKSQVDSNKRENLQNASRLGAGKLRDLAWSLDVLDLSKHNK